MHTEHLQNVGFTRVVAGWLVAIAVSSALVLVFVGADLFGDAGTLSWPWPLLSVLLGFWAGGFFTGFRALEAPILHGLGIGVMSLVAWVLLNALGSLFSSAGADWAGLTASVAIGLVLAQIAAAVIGALMGYNVALRGKPGLSEHEPIEL